MDHQGTDRPGRRRIRFARRTISHRCAYLDCGGNSGYRNNPVGSYFTGAESFKDSPYCCLTRRPDSLVGRWSPSNHRRSSFGGGRSPRNHLRNHNRWWRPTTTRALGGRSAAAIYIYISSQHSHCPACSPALGLASDPVRARIRKLGERKCEQKPSQNRVHGFSSDGRFSSSCNGVGCRNEFQKDIFVNT